MEFLKMRVQELQRKVEQLEIQNASLRSENQYLKSFNIPITESLSSPPIFGDEIHSPCSSTEANQGYQKLETEMFKFDGPSSPQSDSTLNNDQKLFDSLFNFDYGESAKGVFSVLVRFMIDVFGINSVIYNTAIQLFTSPIIVAIFKFVGTRCSNKFSIGGMETTKHYSNTAIWSK